MTTGEVHERESADRAEAIDLAATDGALGDREQEGAGKHGR